MSEPLDKWQFLAAISNSPQVSKTWTYEPRHVKNYYTELLDISRCNFLSINTNQATIFATTFMEHFLALNADQQQRILQVLREVKDF